MQKSKKIALVPGPVNNIVGSYSHPSFQQWKWLIPIEKACFNNLHGRKKRSGKMIADVRLLLNHELGPGMDTSDTISSAALLAIVFR